MKTCHFWVQTVAFAPKKNSLQKAININLTYLLSPFILQNLKKNCLSKSRGRTHHFGAENDPITTQNVFEKNLELMQSYDHATILTDLPWRIFNIIFMYLLVSLSKNWKKLLKLTRVKTMHHLGPKITHWSKQGFFFSEKVTTNSWSTYCAPSLCKI